MPEGAYKITVVSPAKWQKDKATAKINIVDVNGTGWANIRIVVATENGWQTVVDGDDQSAGYAVELRENATIHVSITDRAGNVQAKSEAISCFDSTPPTVKAALAMAGDMTVYGLRDNVRLIREDADGHQHIITLNMNRADIIQSPYYYLQQNDILYVTPNKTKAKTADISASTTIWFSVVSTLVSLASLIITIAK